MLAKNATITLNNGRKIPALGLGTWLSKPGEVGAAVKYALAAGYRHIDCAFIYRNQDEIGKALKEVFAEGQIKREDVFITSKVWNTHHSRARALENINETLQQLGLDYIDLCLIHWPYGFQEGEDLFPKKPGTEEVLYSDVDYLDTYKGMEDAVSAGKVRSLGVSNFNSEQVKRVVDNATVKPVTNQVECHPYFNQSKLKNYCLEHGIFLTAYSPLSNPGSIFRTEGQRMVLGEEVVNKIAQAHSKSPAQTLIRWALQRGTIVIPKSVTKSRIEDNFNVWDFNLSGSEMEQIDGLNLPDGRMAKLERDAGHSMYPFNIEF